MDETLGPPPLLDNIDIHRRDSTVDDDLFVSARQDPPGQEPELVINGSSHQNGNEKNLSNLSLEDEDYSSAKKNEVMENVPISNSSSLPDVMEQAEPNGDQFLEISVKEPQKVGEGMGAYMAYRIETRTNMSIFKNTIFIVTRRFSDFLGLHDKLSEKYLRLGRIIPPAPEKSVISMTKVKISSQSESTPNNGNDFVERRRAALERYLRRTAEHPVLVLDPDFREFLEADIELPKATSTSALSGAGVMRLFNKVGETVNKITYKMDETDPWFEDRLVHIEGLENQLRKLHVNVEAMVTYRKELSHLTNGVSRSAALLSACEDHHSLSRALTHLADTEEKAEALHVEQANTDFFILAEMLKDYLGLLGAVRDAFHERTKLFQHWQHSQQMLAKKRETKAKLELTGRQDKVDQAGTEVIEWEAKVERGQENFDKISKMIKMEIERFEKCRVNDFKMMFIKYFENHLNHQAQLVKFWEAFLPEARAIA